MKRFRERRLQQDRGAPRRSSAASWMMRRLGVQGRTSKARLRRRHPRLGAQQLEPRRVLSGAPNLIANVNSLPFSGSPQYLTEVGSTLFFVADDGVNGSELWKSDGTTAGTVLVKDIEPGSFGASPTSLTAVGNTLYFRAYTATNGSELWKSDGTTAGTVLVKDIRPGGYGSDLTSLTAVGNTLFFGANDGVNGNELWKSDGTTTGTVLVKDIDAGQYGASPTLLTAVGNTLFFRANNGVNGYELWKSDGSGTGTVLVKDIQPGSYGSSPTYLTAVGNTLFFSADDGVNGTELWKSDGSGTGTVLVKDIDAGLYSSSPAWLTAVGNTLFFTANNFTNGNELWKSDGTGTGTVLVKDIDAGLYSSNPAWLTAVGNTLYFRASNFTDGYELWKSDGTGTGTVLVKDIRVPTPLPGQIGDPSVPAITTETEANDGTGTANNLSGSFTAPSAGSPRQAVVTGQVSSANDRDYFRVKIRPGEIVLIDLEGSSTSQGTLADPILEIRNSLDAILAEDDDGGEGSNARLSYTAPSDGSLTEIFIVARGFNSATNVGTYRLTVREVLPDSSDPSYFTAVGNTLYFTADNGANGTELWKSDGTGAGTVLVKDIRPGGSGSPLSSLTAVGNTLFFVADDGVNGTELWKSNGTATGTILVKDIRPGNDGSSLASLTGVGSTLFFAADDGVNGTELWKSDGTGTGTVLVKDLRTGFYGSSPTSLTAVGSTLFFAANDSVNGTELWKSDGTATGTVLVKDIRPGSSGASLTSLAAVGNTLYFTANDGVNGTELWKSDGTATGTVLVKDIRVPTALPGQIGDPSVPAITTETEANDGTDTANNLSGSFVAPSPGSALQAVVTGQVGVSGDKDYFRVKIRPGESVLIDLEGAPTSQGTLSDSFVEIRNSLNTILAQDDDNGEGGNSRLAYTAPSDGSLTEIFIVARGFSTSTGTYRLTVREVRGAAGSDSSNPALLTAVGSTLFFVADDGVNGPELWQSDGTGPATVLVKDIRQGSSGSSLTSPTVIGTTLFFAADDGVNGKELWSFTPNSSPGTIDVPAGQTVTDSMVRTGDQQLVKRGFGTLILDQANTHSGGTIVEAGEVIVRNVAALGTGPLDVRAGAKVTLDVNAANAAVGVFSFADGSLIDFGYGRLTIAANGFSLPLVTNTLRAGYERSWSGADGFTSRNVAAVNGGGLGYVVNDDGSLTFGFAASGDSNLDDVVDILDVSAMLASGKFNSSESASWSEGDFNYDGVIDILDISDVLGASLFNAGTYVPIESSQAQIQPQVTRRGLSVSDTAFVALATESSTTSVAPSVKKRRFAFL